MASCGRVVLGLSGAAAEPTGAQAHATKRRVANQYVILPYKEPAMLERVFAALRKAGLK